MASLGIALLLFGLAVLMLALIRVPLFAVYYTLGNISVIVSTCFMVGPCRQCRSMTQPKRAVCVAVFFVCVILTLLAATQVCIERSLSIYASPTRRMAWRAALRCFARPQFEGAAAFAPALIFATLQLGAALYYVLSYIPFGRKGAKALFKKTVGTVGP